MGATLLSAAAMAAAAAASVFVAAASGPSSCTRGCARGSGLVGALLRRVGPWGRWSVWSLRLSGRWRLRWREGVWVVRCGRRDQRRGIWKRSGGGAWVVGSASRRALEGLGHRQLPLQQLGRSRRRCLRCGRGRPRQCGRSAGGIMVSAGGVDICQGRPPAPENRPTNDRAALEAMGFRVRRLLVGFC